MVTSYRELYNKPTLNVLSAEQIEQIHLATMEVLERTGIRITHLKALELLDGAGASVNGDRVRIPAQMIEVVIGAVVVLGDHLGAGTVKTHRVAERDVEVQ